jgi:hypothetical protein
MKDFYLVSMAYENLMRLAFGYSFNVPDKHKSYEMQTLLRTENGLKIKGLPSVEKQFKNVSTCIGSAISQIVSDTNDIEIIQQLNKIENEVESATTGEELLKVIDHVFLAIDKSS